MGIYKYEEILLLLRIITTVAIPVLSMFIYKVCKNKKILFFAITIIVELIILQITIHDLYPKFIYVNQILMIFIVVKLYVIFLLKKNNGYSDYKNVLLMIVFCILNYIIFGSTKLGDRILDIILNLWLITNLCNQNVYIKYKENELNKKKLSNNKKYIWKILNKIKEKEVIEQELSKEIKVINSKIHSVVHTINMPIVIIRCSDYKCIYKNEYFDEFLMKRNVDVNNFEIDNFIKKSFKLKYENIFDMAKNFDFSKENIISFEMSNKKYHIVLVKENYEGEEVIICECKDITEIFREEKHLKVSEARYETLVNILSGGVIIHDGLDISYINKVALNIFGLSENSVNTIEKIKNKISKKSKDDFINNIFNLKNDLKSRDKHKLELENGKVIEFVSSVFTLNNKKMILSIINDFTEYEIALSKLSENRQTYSTLLQTLPEGIVLVNKYTKKQIYINKYMMRVLKDMGIERFNEIIDSYIESGKSNKFETFYMNSDKNKKISIAIEEVPNQNNLLIIVRDLQIEQQMEEVYNNLQVIKARNKFKTEFLIRASSNLKKPINTIFEVNKFLDSKKDIYNYKGVKSYTKTVKQSAYRLKRLLNNIEEISEIESGIYCKDYKTYDIVNYLRELVNLCSEHTKQKNIDIKFESSRKEILLYMDKRKIEKIILNILSNAIKFTENGGQIKVSLTTNERDVIIAIKDNGSGIPSNKIDFIFENFEQVNRSLSRTAEGTGVGLYLVKKLAQIHNAKIKVNSKIGCGSKFEIILKDNFLESSKENKNKVEDIIIDKEDIDLEFSDIYLV